jgi:hypothetical protein
MTVTGAVFSTLAFIALQAVAGTLKLADATRVYARRSLIDQTAVADFQNALEIDAALVWPKVQLEAGYAPRFTFAQGFGSAPDSGFWLHSALARLSLREPRYTLSLMQTGTIGEQDFARTGGTIALEQPASGDPMMAPKVLLIPNARFLPVAAEETTGKFTYLWSRRWRSDIQASFGFSGGSNIDAQMILPRQRKTQLDTALDFDWSRRDEFSSALSGVQVETSNGYEHWLASLTETWSRRWTSSSGADLGLGVAFQDTLGPDQSRQRAWVPIGSANVTQAILTQDMQLRFRLGIGYGPNVNVILGRLQERLQVTALTSLTTARMTVSVTLAAAQTLPTDAPDASRLASAALAFEYALLDWLRGQLGGQATRQQLALLGTRDAGSTAWLLYAGLEARAPAFRF